MSFIAEHWEALSSLLLSVVAIVIAIYSARKTSKDATRQIESIKKLAKIQIEATIKQMQVEIEKNQIQIDLAMQETNEMKSINESGISHIMDARELMVRAFNERRPERIYNVYQKHTVVLKSILEGLKKIEL